MIVNGWKFRSKEVVVVAKFGFTTVSLAMVLGLSLESVSPGHKPYDMPPHSHYELPDADVRYAYDIQVDSGATTANINTGTIDLLTRVVPGVFVAAYR
jgi:hypothetical protein